MSAGMTFRIRPEGREQLRRAIAEGGMVNLGGAAETAVKSRTPVRGGFRSFQAGAHLGGPLGIVDVGSQRRLPAGTGIGGTLRRSVHFVVYLDGRRITPRRTDDNDRALPDYIPAMGIVLYVGTNSGYGFWVQAGTSKMAARPYLTEGWGMVRGDAVALIGAGTRRKLGQ